MSTPAVILVIPAQAYLPDDRHRKTTGFMAEKTAKRAEQEGPGQHVLSVEHAPARRSPLKICRWVV